MTQEKGANSRSKISAAHLANLNAGTAQSRTLSEALAIDHTVLLKAVIEDPSQALIDAADRASTLGILKRMAAIASALRDTLSAAELARLRTHPADTVRGWWCFALASDERFTAAELLAQARPLADDESFAVREWVWMALRPRLTRDLSASIELLRPWTLAPEAHIRRFASESLRPRGVWASHIPELKAHPERGEPLLEPLKSDPSRYVQDSVANWINDAAKSSPEWAIALCERWNSLSPSEATSRITTRALRSIS